MFLKTAIKLRTIKRMQLLSKKKKKRLKNTLTTHGGNQEALSIDIQIKTNQLLTRSLIKLSFKYIFSCEIFKVFPCLAKE